MYRILSLVLTFGMLCSMAPFAEADTVTLGWAPNTEPDLAGYRLHYGGNPRAQATYTQTIPINMIEKTKPCLILNSPIHCLTYIS